MATMTIPYAVADFVDLRERGFYYVDKTNYISKLEYYNAPMREFSFKYFCYFLPLFNGCKTAC